MGRTGLRAGGGRRHRRARPWRQRRRRPAVSALAGQGRTVPTLRNAVSIAAMIAVAALLGNLIARGGYMALAAIALGCALPLLTLVTTLGYRAVSVWLVAGAV